MSNLQILQNPKTAEKIEQIMGDKKKTNQFLTSALSVLSSNELLKKADQNSIYQSVMTAVTLNLPINPNLGFAYLVPYKGKAQFQIGYKGLIQLCWRSGNFKTISSTEVYEGQLIQENPLTGFKFDWSKKVSNKVIGYASYFELLNGASKTFYMSKDAIENHAKKFSQSYKKGFGVWNDDFHSMAKKTVLKLLLSRYAPMSIELQKATMLDQAVVKDFENEYVEHIDNQQAVELPELKIDSKNFDNFKKGIQEGKTTIEDLEKSYYISGQTKEALC